MQVKIDLCTISTCIPDGH